MTTHSFRSTLALSSTLGVALAAPGAMAMPSVFTAGGSFGVGDDVFGTATVLELLGDQDTFSLNVPIHAFTVAPGGHGGRGMGDTMMWYGQYAPDASITFNIDATGVSHTYGLGPHGLTYEVRDNVMTEEGPRDELVIEFWPTPNSEARHEGSIFTFNIFASFAADTWDGTDPVRSIDLGSALSAGASLRDDENFGIPVTQLTSFSVPAPGAAVVFGLGLFGVSRRRR